MKISEQKLFKNKAEAAGILLFLILAVLPLLFGILYSLLYSFGVIGLVSDGATAQYWKQALSDVEFWLSLGYTFYIALTTIILTIGGAFILLLFLKQQLRQGVPGFAIYIPLAFPAIVVAFLFFQLATQSGFIARIAFQMGIINNPSAFPELINDPWGIGIIAAHIFMALPFFTLYFINLHDQLNVDKLALVGQSLGATSAEQIKRIIVPLILRRSASTITLYTIFVLGSYEIPLILGRQTPQMISVLVIRKLRRFSLSTIPEAYVTALVFISIIFFLLVTLLKTQKVSYGHDS